MCECKYMQLALENAKKGIGFVNPNPMVGAVIVKNGKIIGEGYHKKYGGLHAERNALNNCSENPKDATMYVTLEPCCHYGKTPPCTDAIIENKIKKVVIASLDPNPKMSGKSLDILKKRGIKVEKGLLENEGDKLNETFRKFITTKKPFVLFKYAMTMDGKIATKINESKWITGEEARLNVQKTRHKYSGIMVGVDTVIIDNPMLNCKIENGLNPIRIICDTNLRTPIGSKIVSTAKEIPTIIATCSDDEIKKEQYIEKGCEILQIKIKKKKIDLQDLMSKLGEKKIDSILLEGGATLAWSAFERGIVDKIQAYIAPKIFGGNGKTAVLGEGVDFPKDAIMLKNSEIFRFGDDFMIESDVTYKCSQE